MQKSKPAEISKPVLQPVTKQTKINILNNSYMALNESTFTSVILTNTGSTHTSTTHNVQMQKNETKTNKKKQTKKKFFKAYRDKLI